MRRVELVSQTKLSRQGLYRETRLRCVRSPHAQKKSPSDPVWYTMQDDRIARTASPFEQGGLRGICSKLAQHCFEKSPLAPLFQRGEQNHGKAA